VAVMQHNRPVAFYDGGCPVCRREIAHYQRLDREGAVEWRDIHARPEVLSDVDISWETAMRRFHCLDETGRLRHGVDGFAVIWARLPYWRWLARLVRGTRLVGPLDRVYAWYADRRYVRRCGASGCDTSARD